MHSQGIIFRFLSDQPETDRLQHFLIDFGLIQQDSEQFALRIFFSTSYPCYEKTTCKELFS